MRRRRGHLAPPAALLAALVAILLAAGLLGLPAARGQSERATPGVPPTGEAAAAERSPAMVLMSQPAWVPPDGTAVIELRIDRPADGLEVVVTAHRAVTSRSALSRALEGRALGATEGTLRVPVGSLPVDAEGDRLLALGVQGTAPPDPVRLLPGRTGVYPVSLELVGEDGEAITAFVTPVVVLAPGLVPLTLAMVWPLDATPGRLPDGRIRPSAGRAMAPGGRLVRMVEAAADFSDVPLTLAPAPETLETWAEAARGRQLGAGTAADGLAHLREAPGRSTRQILGSPYVPVNLPALHSAGLTSEIDRQFQRGMQAQADVLGVRPSSGTLLAGEIDPPSLARLRQFGVERIVVPPSALVPIEQRLTPGRPFALSARGRPITAAVSDPGLATLLTGDAPPALRAARFLAATSLVALEAPRDPRGVVVVAPRDWDAPAPLLEAVLVGLRSNPAIRADTLDGFFATVPKESRNGESFTRVPAASDSDDTDFSVGTIRAIRQRLVAFRQVVGAGEPPARSVDRAILVSQASALRGDGRRARPSPRDYLEGANQLIRTVTGRIQGPDGQRVTLTARQARIPISLLNANERPIHVLVRLESDQLRFPGGSERLLTLPPQNTTASFAVETRSPGAFPLIITVTSPDGELVVHRSELTIRSTVVSGVGAMLTAGAGAFLLIWWGNNLRRSRQRPRPQAPTEHTPPTGTAAERERQVAIVEMTDVSDVTSPEDRVTPALPFG